MHSYMYTHIRMQIAKKKGKEWVNIKIIELKDKFYQHKLPFSLHQDTSCIRTLPAY